jgi:hypothetical protein
LIGGARGRGVIARREKSGSYTSDGKRLGLRVVPPITMETMYIVAEESNADDNVDSSGEEN